MSRRQKNQARSQAHRENIESGAQRATRQSLLRPIVVVLLLVAVAVAAWIVRGSRDQGPSAPASTVDLLASNEPASNDTDAANPPTGDPRIVFPETSYDFGTITQGANVSHTFVVRNAGDAPLKLIEVKGS